LFRDYYGLSLLVYYGSGYPWIREQLRPLLALIRGVSPPGLGAPPLSQMVKIRPDRLDTAASRLYSIERHRWGAKHGLAQGPLPRWEPRGAELDRPYRVCVELASPRRGLARAIGLKMPKTRNTAVWEILLSPRYSPCWYASEVVLSRTGQPYRAIAAKAVDWAWQRITVGWEPNRERVIHS